MNKLTNTGHMLNDYIPPDLIGVVNQYQSAADKEKVFDATPEEIESELRHVLKKANNNIYDLLGYMMEYTYTKLTQAQLIRLAIASEDIRSSQDRWVYIISENDAFKLVSRLPKQDVDAIFDAYRPKYYDEEYEEYNDEEYDEDAQDLLYDYFCRYKDEIDVLYKNRPENTM